MSCHNQAQALKAQAQGASYVNLGPVFPTQTKSASPVGLDLVAWGERHLTIPFTVMGGIHRSNIEAVLRAGAKKIAVVTALSQNRDVEAEAKYLIKTIRGKKFHNCRFFPVRHSRTEPVPRTGGNPQKRHLFRCGFPPARE